MLFYIYNKIDKTGKDLLVKFLIKIVCGVHNYAIVQYLSVFCDVLALYNAIFIDQNFVLLLFYNVRAIINEPHHRYIRFNLIRSCLGSKIPIEKPWQK